MLTFVHSFVMTKLIPESKRGEERRAEKSCCHGQRTPRDPSHGTMAAKTVQATKRSTLRGKLQMQNFRIGQCPASCLPRGGPGIPLDVVWSPPCPSEVPISTSRRMRGAAEV